jgi:hypothetical protein
MPKWMKDILLPLTSPSWTWGDDCWEVWVRGVRVQKDTSLHTHTRRSRQIADTIPDSWQGFKSLIRSHQAIHVTLTVLYLCSEYMTLAGGGGAEGFFCVTHSDCRRRDDLLGSKAGALGLIPDEEMFWWVNRSWQELDTFMTLEELKIFEFLWGGSTMKLGLRLLWSKVDQDSIKDFPIKSDKCEWWWTMDFLPKEEWLCRFRSMFAKILMCINIWMNVSAVMTITHIITCLNENDECVGHRQVKSLIKIKRW